MNPINPIPEPYRAALGAVAIVLVLVSCYALGRSDGAADVKAEWDEAKLEQQRKADEAEEEARNRERALSDKVIEAQNEAKKREAQIMAERDAARRSSDGLRDDLAALRRGLPGDSPDACRATADAALAVLGECAAEIGRLAEAADGHASDVKTLIDAWPRIAGSGD